MTLQSLAGKDGTTASARLPRAHLADHPAAAEKLAAVLAPGATLGPLLVLGAAAAEERWKGEGGKKKKGKKSGGLALLVSSPRIIGFLSTTLLNCCRPAE